MLKLFKESFKTANDCIILAIPLVLFIWILSFYLGYANKIVDKAPEFIIATVTVLIMTGAFFSGWFYMVKKGIEASKGIFVLDADRVKAIGDLLKLMPRGIAKLFIPLVCVFLLFKICSVLLYFIINLAGTNLIGEVYTAEQASQILSSSPQELISFLETLSEDQINKLRLWNVLIISTTTVYLFSLMLWIPEIIYLTQNPFFALFKSIKKVYIKFWKSVILFVYLTILNIITSIISTFALTHPLLYLLIMVVIFYYVIYSVILIFSFYRQEFCETEVKNEQKA